VLKPVGIVAWMWQWVFSPVPVMLALEAASQIKRKGGI
jgi:hypothetical protein